MIHSLLLVATLTGCNTDSATEVSIQKAISVISAEAQTGTLLFSKGDCLAVRVFSRSRYTHVGAVVMEGKKIIIYDSMNGVGVRKLTLEKYLRKQSPDDHVMYHPAIPLSKSQIKKFKTHLEEELGRPYGFAHYMTRKRAKGIHCAEYVTEALQKCDVLQVEHPSHVSPGSLMKGITGHQIYTLSKTVPLDEEPIVAKKGKNRCHQCWLDTKACSQRCTRKMKHWFACR